MTQHVLEMENVCKTYGKFTAVSDMNISIPRGSIYGFLGPNGAGKTTTIRMILDIIKPDSGRISVLGQDSALKVRQKIGYLPEEKGLYKKMKVRTVIAYFAMLKGLDKSTAENRADVLLTQYGLFDFADARVESLSKGMGQKVQVLSAVAHEPELVILDEPFSGLDPVNQQVLETLIQDMATAGQTVIFSTHVMEHAQRLCDQILLIAKGRKIFDGSVSDARALIPRRVVLETADNIESLHTLSSISNITPMPPTVDGEDRWMLQIPKETQPQEILKFCFDRGISPSRFDYAEPSLHDVFVHLVGSDATEHSFR